MKHNYSDSQQNKEVFDAKDTFYDDFDIDACNNVDTMKTLATQLKEFTTHQRYTPHVFDPEFDISTHINKQLPGHVHKIWYKSEETYKRLPVNMHTIPKKSSVILPYK